ncbi:Uncharacterised protein [Mycobacteroides abscessus subsp. abscessus]|nr:Uncharacterised protein [Mycobacteroides abscessus subsp. abscessus]
MPAHQREGRLAQRRRQRRAERSVAHEQVGRIAGRVADLEAGDSIGQETGHMDKRAQLGRVTMHNRLDIRASAVDLGVDEPLQV